jgi:WhiB family redox-sensing transcriptional regulator
MADTTRLPGPNADTWDWQLNGSCRGMDSGFFFHPEGERGPARAKREARAKAVCRSCPVLDLCRRHALEVEEPYGVWGGMSEAERDNVLKARRRSVRYASVATPV